MVAEDAEAVPGAEIHAQVDARLHVAVDVRLAVDVRQRARGVRLAEAVQGAPGNVADRARADVQGNAVIPASQHVPPRALTLAQANPQLSYCRQFNERRSHEGNSCRQNRN